MKRAVVIFVALMFASCGHRQGPLAADIERSNWEAGKTYSLVYNNEDTLSLREINIFVVHERFFAERVDSLPIMIATQTPDSIIYSEVWNLYPEPAVPGQTAVWHETKAIYRSSVLLSQGGDYTFTFSHMLLEDLNGVVAIGVDIVEESNNK